MLSRRRFLDLSNLLAVSAIMPPICRSTRIVVVDGNSLSTVTPHTAVYREWTRYLDIKPIPLVNVAIGRDSIVHCIDRLPIYVLPLISVFDEKIVIIWEGTNALGSMTADDAFVLHVDYAKKLRAQGAKVIIGTVVNRATRDLVIPWPEHELLRLRFNQLVRANWREFDGIMDVGASPEMGSDGAALTDYFYDGIHISNRGGEVVAQYAQAAIALVLDKNYTKPLLERQRFPQVMNN